jgi:hypothetical protein
MKMLGLIALGLATATAVGAQQGGTASHQAEVNRRGAHVMRFDQDATVHRFSLYEDGGAIEVNVKASADKTNREAIRAHLPHIAAMFAAGDFEAPMLVHDTNVPGTADMTRLRALISYRYVETAHGGRIDIVAADAEAVSAVHRFLRFQIDDHRTGDSTEVRKR